MLALPTVLSFSTADTYEQVRKKLDAEEAAAAAAGQAPLNDINATAYVEKAIKMIDRQYVPDIWKNFSGLTIFAHSF